MKRLILALLLIVTASAAWAQYPPVVQPQTPWFTGLMTNQLITPLLTGPLIGNGTSPVTSGTTSGNTSEFVTGTGSFSPGHCPIGDSGGNLIDSGMGCGGGGGGGGSVAYSTHAALIAAVTTNVGNSISQAVFANSGDLGGAAYDWNSGSYCPGGTNISPVAADGLVCILPSGQSSGTPGRYIIRVPSGGLSVTAIGMAPGGQDNAPFIPALMTAIAAAPNSLAGGYDVFFPPTLGQPFTTYYFTKSLVLERGGKFYCGGGPDIYNSVILSFAPGVHGVIQEAFNFTASGGSGLGTVEGCLISDQGYATTGSSVSEGATTITGVTYVDSSFGSGSPKPTWAQGDGIIITPTLGAFFPDSVIPAVAPGAYVGTVNSQTSLTLGGSYSIAQQWGAANAIYTETGQNNFLNGDTITIANNTYNAVTAIGSTPGNFLIGANFLVSIQNLANCINLNTTTATCVAQSVATTATAEFPTANTLKLWAATGGTGGNSLASTDTSSAGSFGSSTFVSGFATAGASIYQLPISQAFSVETSSGSNQALVLSGPRHLEPGEVVWSDAFGIYSTILTALPTSQFTETSTNNFSAGDTILAGNNTFTFVSSLVGTQCNVLIGVNFAASAANFVAAANRASGDGSTYNHCTTVPNISAVTNAWPASVNTINVSPTSSFIGIGGFAYQSVYTQTGTSAGSFQAATFTYQTLAMYNIGYTAVSNATATHSSPANLWIMPAGLKRDVGASAVGISIQTFPIGLEMICTVGGSDFNCDESTDTNNRYTETMIAKVLSGDNTGDSTSNGEKATRNFVVDLADLGSIASTYTAFGSQSYEASTARYAQVFNCAAATNPPVLGGYVASSSAGGCASLTTLIPPTVGGPLYLSPNDNFLSGQPVILSSNSIGYLYGQWKNTSGFNGQTCLQFGGPTTGGTAGSVLAFSTAACGSTTLWRLEFDSPPGAWNFDYDSAGSALRLIGNGLGYTGYYNTFNGIGVMAPLGILLDNSEAGDATGVGARNLDAGATVPTETWHIPGNDRLNIAAVPGSNVLWADVPLFSTTLTQNVVKGTSQSGITLTACPSPALTGTVLVVDATLAPPATLGTLSTCSGTLNLTTTALNNATNGDTIKFTQWAKEGTVQDTIPAISSCGTGSPAMTTGSNNLAGQFTMGTGSPTACTIAFAHAYPTAAFCSVAPASSGGAAITGGYYLSAMSAAGFTLTLGTGTNSLVFDYSCGGT